MLSNISIGIRIALMVATSLLTITILIFIAASGEGNISEATRVSTQIQYAFDVTTTVERAASMMQNLATRFITDRDAGAANAFKTQAEIVEKGLTRLQGMPGAAAGETDIKQLSGGLGTIIAAFEQIENQARIIGLDDASGLRGQLKTSSQAVEDELKLWPNLDKLIVPMMSMRIQEKNYFIYGDAGVMGPYRKGLSL